MNKLILSLFVMVGLVFASTSATAQAKSEHDIAFVGTGNYTTPSIGEFNNQTVIRQTSKVSAGGAVGYEYWRHSNGYIAEFSYTPTDSRLFALDGTRLTQWPLQRYKIDFLYEHRFRLTKTFDPYLGTGYSQVVLWGGNAPAHSNVNATGWDTQSELLVAGGVRYKLSSRLSLKAGILVDVGKANTYGDPTYQSSQNLMLEPQLGLVFKLNK